ncbi:MAG: hypothetical protein ACREMR_03880 [Gemmatimonadales bacterium]
MLIEPSDFRNRMRVLLELQGEALSDTELSHMAQQYPRCGGKGHWDVRDYARVSGLGAREYRVLRGSGVQEIYCSAERASAVAVRTALNQMESQEQTLGAIA